MGVRFQEEFPLTLPLSFEVPGEIVITVIPFP